MTKFEKSYAVICDCKDGVYRVSVADFDNSQMYYRLEETEYEDEPGIWGYADSEGKEIITPQFIYAYDFYDGLAYAARGKWEQKKEWDNKYWTDEILWGRIDKNGKEVIPCKFDRIKSFNYIDKDSCYLMAHYGGWENGKWGVIDYKGNWVIEPAFYRLDYEIYNDDLIVFQKPYSFDELYGLYSIKQNRILFESEYGDIIFKKDTIILEEYGKPKKITTVKYRDMENIKG